MDILNVEKLTNEKWLNLFAAEYRHKDHTGRWVFASRRPDPRQLAHTADAVVIVAILRTPGQPPRLVVEKEFRVPAGGYVYGLPAGLLEPGESVEDAVRRELREETGLEVTAVKKISPAIYSSAGMTDETAILVFVDVRETPDTKQALEASEEIEVQLLDHAQVVRLCNSTTERIDKSAWGVLYLYERLGELA
jgi:ADP-ribose pyrophosphatase